MSLLIKPFKATCYNLKKIKDLASVVCPPYDVINETYLKSLKARSKYNFARILLANNDDYKALGLEFNRWLKEGVLVDDDKDTLYLYEQKFSYDGKSYKRYGLLTLLKTDNQGVIFPHEYTHKAAKVDRSKMISEMKANLSPIFVVVPKKLTTLTKTYLVYSKKKPQIQFVDDAKIKNRVWKITDQKTIDDICKEVDKTKLIIADGHHRFEVASSYYQKNKGKFENLNYCVTFLADEQPGLLMLATHRIVNKEGNEVFKKLDRYFEIELVSQKVLQEKLKTAAKELETKGVFSLGVYSNKKFFLLTLKNKDILKKVLKNPLYKKLDTYILHNFIFSLLGITEKPLYTPSLAEAKKLTTKTQTAFLLGGSTLKSVFSIANKGLRLPQKSTYFYPKVTSGLVVRRFKK
ncbi:MAG: DUF1015 domain-containing protein [Candidatus Omnitrophica bacterium]|nr:DUF1015 domain-containing protein [Candidatus Omnitrophota bacterium]